MSGYGRELGAYDRKYDIVEKLATRTEANVDHIGPRKRSDKPLELQHRS